MASSGDTAYDLSLIFNIGIIDNDRSRRGELLMEDVLGRAVAALSLNGGGGGGVGVGGGIGSGGVLGSTGVDDAHRRLFPSDSPSASLLSSAAGLGSGVLNEQRLRELLSGEREAGAQLPSQQQAQARRSSNRKRRRSAAEGKPQAPLDDAPIYSSGGGGGGDEELNAAMYDDGVRGCCNILFYQV